MTGPTVLTGTTRLLVALAVVAGALPVAVGAAPAAAQAACAPWCVLDAFDDRGNGSLRTQGPWRTNQPGATDGAWATDEAPVAFSGTTMVNQPDGILHRSNAYAVLGGLAIPQGARGTLFFEVQTDDVATTDLSLGLSDDASPGLGFDGTGDAVSFGDFEAQVTLRERGLVVRDGGTSRTVGNVALAPDRRYAVWLVVDNAADTYQVRVQPAGGSVTVASADGRTTFAFRNGTASAPLVTYLNLNGGSPVPSSRSWVDNLFVAPGAAATSDPSPAFDQVLDLEGLPAGAINGRDGWTASSALVAVTADPADAANQVLEMTGPGLRAHRAVPGIQEGRRGTLFLRVRRAGNVNLSAGLSDVAAPTGFADFEAQANVQNTAVLNARDGGAFAPAGTSADGQWQCVWLVADTAANRYELHVRGGPYARRVQLPQDAARTFGFRNGANAAALARLLLINGTTSPGRLLFDDLAVDPDGRNLRVPSGDASDCAGVGGNVPVEDPIPGDITPSGLGVTLTPFATIPASASGAPRARINFLGEVPRPSTSAPRRLFVPDLRGDLWFLTPAGAPSRYLDVQARFPDFVDEPRLGTGFGFVAFHPQFAANGRFYTAHTEAGAALARATTLPGPADPVVHGVVTEWTASNPAAATFSGTSREVLRVGFDTFLHGLQEVGFDPTVAPGAPGFGLLHIALGDGEENPNWTDGPQDLGVPHGKVLRIDPRGTNGPGGRYGIPASNPFVGRAGALGEILVLGLRNPHRFTWDPADGDLLVSNIGEANIDAVYRAEPGDNYGWNVREGGFRFEKSDPSNVYPLPPDDAGFTYPVAAYDHDEGRAIAGGFVYRGTAVPELYGKYVFGDIVEGRVLYAEVAEMVRGGELATIRELRLFDPAGAAVTMTQLAGNSRVDLRLGADAAGELYVLAKANGRIWRVGSVAPAASGTAVAGVLGAGDWDPQTPSRWSFTGAEAILREAGTAPPGPRRPFEIATLGAGPVWGDVQVDAAVRLDTPATVSDRDVVVVFGRQSPTRYYYAHLSQDTTIYPHNGIFLVDDADRLRIDDQWNGSAGAPPAVTDEAYHQVRVRHDADSGRIEVFVDDLRRPLMTATDTTLRSGRIGFGSFDNIGRLTDLVVTGTPVP